MNSYSYRNNDTNFGNLSSTFLVEYRFLSSDMWTILTYAVKGFSTEFWGFMDRMSFFFFFLNTYFIDDPPRKLVSMVGKNKSLWLERRNFFHKYRG